jgi:hypothetical protein
MATEFQVGQLVIMQNGTYFTECDGFLAVIIEGGKNHRPMNMITLEYEAHFVYKVKVIKEVDQFTVDNGELYVRPWQIRPLKDSDEQELVEELLDIPTTVESILADQ